MRVKRLEIQGFKSFKDKTVVHFDHAITGIVGPNGCGKSNIVDAFFWVMGEQSYKHMRGSSSEDLIFNGSSKYPALGFAEATLVMESGASDTANAPTGATYQDEPIHLRTKEVAVTRRVYRTGEGEYFINGVQARLKDIQELFMDTGVGAKGYSVVEQGQIGKIVNAKPEERRLLVEEAAGIAKYKARKKESLRKMDATYANLSRLTDVIQEIERNLESLERQAQKARLYSKYKEELAEKEITWTRRKTKIFKQKLEELTKEKSLLEEELVTLKLELQETEASVETGRVGQISDSRLAEEFQLTIQDLSDQLTRQQSALDLSKQRQNDLAIQEQTLERERRELEETVATEKEKVSLNQAEAHKVDVEFVVLAEKVKAKDEQVQKTKETARIAREQVNDSKRKLMERHNRELLE